jgi:D-aspartate ligase
MMNIKSVLIYCNKNEFARGSKYVSDAYKCPLWSDYKAIKNFLIKKKNVLKNGILIPTTDFQIETLAIYRKELSQYYTVPVPEYKVVEKFLDKMETYRIAKKAGIDIPYTFYPKSEEEALKNLQDMQFPLIIKPRERDKFLDYFNKKLFIIYDKSELIEKLRLCFKNGFKVMITEIIPGPDTQLYEYDFYVDKNGEIICGIGHVKLRQTPPNFGIGRVQKTIINKEVEELTKKFLRHLPDFFGPGQIEFKFDHRDNKYKLIEMNGRLTLQNELFARAGINLPYLYYQDWVKNKSIVTNSYIENFYWIHLYNDLKNFAFRRRQENYSLNDYIYPYLKKHIYGIESLSDPKPMILFWSQKFKNLSRYI